jgi:hypothetical protein
VRVMAYQVSHPTQDGPSADSQRLRAVGFGRERRGGSIRRHERRL